MRCWAEARNSSAGESRRDMALLLMFLARGAMASIAGCWQGNIFELNTTKDFMFGQVPVRIGRMLNPDGTCLLSDLIAEGLESRS